MQGTTVTPDNRRRLLAAVRRPALELVVQDRRVRRVMASVAAGGTGASARLELTPAHISIPSPRPGAPVSRLEPAERGAVPLPWRPDIVDVTQEGYPDDRENFAFGCASNAPSGANRVLAHRICTCQYDAVLRELGERRFEAALAAEEARGLAPRFKRASLRCVARDRG